MELIRWNLAEHFGWTLPEIDALTMADLREFMQIIDGRGKAIKDMEPKAGKNG